ncbi:MAG: 2-oxoacid:acceptor oxidoreductase family protein [Planctomycetota bacterium]|nr:2-oxoacid:acceptor oxidoreductase family protein [Planctomycetota bacterium]
MELRLHGRGGQGGVTCAKILAAAWARMGQHVQTFGDYAGERSGAPVRAYTRTSPTSIENRNKVYTPDHVIVLDRHLLGRDVVEGLKDGGILLVNAPGTPDTLGSAYGTFRLATVDATEIARRRGIGTRSVVIVNTTIAGAFARLAGIPLEVLEDTYRQLGFSGNFEAAREAWERVVERAPTMKSVAPQAALPVAAPVEVEPLVEHLESKPTGLRTGSWSTQRPRYVEHAAPCSAFCPAGNDVVGFVQAAAHDDMEAAARMLKRTTPLAGVCGRVCPAPCMDGCNRAELDGAVNVRGLERWVSDRAPLVSTEAKTPAKRLEIAVVGGGPAGLGAAHELLAQGHGVTLFERERELGGLLVTGIPNYRLPRNVLHREVASLLARGLRANCGEDIDAARLASLEREFDAVVVATGLQQPTSFEVPGKELRGVEDGVTFLRRANLLGGMHLQGHVVVLGGGNTAMDCARVALRCGASRVTVLYRRTRAEMPAIPEEIEHALVEGVELCELRQALRFEGTAKLESVFAGVVELGEPDASGRRAPRLTDDAVRIPCNHVLLAFGSSADRSLLPKGWELRGSRLVREGVATRVFACGDFALADGTVAHAIGSGRRIAGELLRALVDPEVVAFARPSREESVAATEVRFDHFERSLPAHEELLPRGARIRGFSEVSRGLADASEARRCFSCGHCTRCDTCLVYCPEGVVRRTDVGYELDASYCKGCGICVHECPRKGMEMSHS